MATLDLNRLPYDLWISTFNYLDRRTSLNACLASRSLNELASWPLYSSIVVNPHAKQYFSRLLQANQPFIALERRPHLRNAVLEIEIYFTGRDYYQSDWEKEGGLQEWQDCSQAMRLLPRATTVHLRPWINSPEVLSREYESDALFEAITALPAVRRLNISKMPSNCISLINRIPKIYWKEHVYLGENIRDRKFAKRVKEMHLRSWNQGGSYGHLISLFCNLNDLSVDVQKEALQSDVFVALRMMPFLRRLWLNDLPNILPKKHQPYMSTRLKQLETLSLTFGRNVNWTSARKTSTELVGLLEHLAGRSQLTQLTVEVIRQRRVEFCCRRWLPQILRKHKSTLRELMIPQFHTGAESARLIFTQCPALERLKMALNDGIQMLLPELILFSRNLVVLQLYLSHDMDEWTHTNSMTLINSSPSLRKVEICITARLIQNRNEAEVFKTSWVAEWYYDSAKDCAIRRVKGPEKASYPPPEWQKGESRKQRTRIIYDPYSQGY